jgi:hypothetical protein
MDRLVRGSGLRREDAIVNLVAIQTKPVVGDV